MKTKIIRRSLAALLLCPPLLALAAPVKPDIIFILADDLGYADVGWHGSDIKTPVLDQLAASGAKLEHLYAMPVCSPARAALMTGRYPIRTGLQMNIIRPTSKYGLPLEERLLPQALREAGYTTVMCGKWHLGSFEKAYWPNQRGFDHWYGFLEGSEDYFTHKLHGKGDKLDWYRNGELLPHDEGYSTHLLAREAVGLIRQQPKDKPLFLYVPFNAVHGPLECPAAYTNAITKMTGQRQVLAGVAAAMDEDCGKILAALDETGRRKNAVIVFCSDNGGIPPGKNLPLRAFKSSIYEGGIRSVGFAVWDGHIKPGLVINEPMHLVDWFPTLVKIAGGSLEQKLPLDGLDILPTIAEGKPSPHAELLLNATPKEGAIRMGDFKLVVNGSDAVGENVDPETGERKKSKQENKAARVRGQRQEDKLELFNLREDPSESKDLAVQMPEKVKAMRARYDEYYKAAAKPLNLVR
ncbi:MAG: arylsulfatase [Verrucomicrobia bacterium]|nr:arylsulfatase [Verrucomicrobiota bacterium]